MLQVHSTISNGVTTNYVSNPDQFHRRGKPGKIRRRAVVPQTGTTNYDRQGHLTGVIGPAGPGAISTMCSAIVFPRAGTADDQLRIDPGSRQAVGEYDAGGALLAHNVYGTFQSRRGRQRASSMLTPRPTLSRSLGCRGLLEPVQLSCLRRSARQAASSDNLYQFGGGPA